MTKDENVTKVDGGGAAKEKSGRQRGRDKREKVKPPTKIIVRHLPPTMTEDEFLKQIDPLPEHDCYYFAAADWSLGYDATCRAYLTVKRYEDVFLFRDRFDGYVFVDAKGAEYSAIVEFAPFQGLLKNKSRRSDNKVGSIEKELHYQQFLAKLEEDREAAAKGGECKLEFTLDRKKEEKITSTPLLQYLANKKEKRREEARKRSEEKRRQRDEDKDKRRGPGQGQQVTKIMSGGGRGEGGGVGGRSEGGGRGGGGGGGEGNGKEAGKRGGGGTDGGKPFAGGKENAGGGGKSGEGASVPQEERKNSRSKRRAERDQRRREEHEQRKREQRERGGAVGIDKEKSGEIKKEEYVSKEITTKDEKTYYRDDTTQKFENQQQRDKKQNRKKERNRNRKDKFERESERKKEVAESVELNEEHSKVIFKSMRSIISEDGGNNKTSEFKTAQREKRSDEGAEHAQRAERAERVDRAERAERTEREERAEAEINESVRSFIRSVASAKEFVPRYKQQQATAAMAAMASEGARMLSYEDLNERRNEAGEWKLIVQLENMAPTSSTSHSPSDGGDEDERKTNRKAPITTSSEKAERTNRHLQKQRSAEERRIRNKDRPSIAIYQPKLRTRASEESDSNNAVSASGAGGKDMRSNPTSDCESVKKDDQPQKTKKVSRYSERRTERRLQQQQQQQEQAAAASINCDDKPKLEGGDLEGAKKSKSAGDLSMSKYCETPPPQQESNVAGGNEQTIDKPATSEI